MDSDLISRQALLRGIREGLKGFPPFTDDGQRVEWIMRQTENTPAEREAAGVNGNVASDCIGQPFLCIGKT